MPAGGGSVDRAPDSKKDKREFETGKAQIFFYHKIEIRLQALYLTFMECAMDKNLVGPTLSI